MDGSLHLPEPAAADALAKFEAFLDATPELGVVWAQDKGDTLACVMKRRFAATKRGRETQPLRTFAAWCAAQPDQSNLLPADHAVFRWAESIELPEYFVWLAWCWFREYYGQKGANSNKKYRDWLATFDDSVRRRYGKLWCVGPDGKFKLTTEGQIMARQFPDEDRA